jgi:hypothetical protein
MTLDDDFPRSMRDEGVRERRRLMLDQLHIAPLAAYAAKLRERGSVEVPEFDPLDGGTNARYLFLFEKPGPMTAQNGKRKGSGFISRNNDDATAAAAYDFWQEARIPREQTVSWNVIPWWNGTVKISKEELSQGVQCVRELIALLPNLRAVVMVGRRAAKARPYLESTRLKLFTSDHPGPKVRAVWPDRWKAIASKWIEVREFVESGGSDA